MACAHHPAPSYAVSAEELGMRAGFVVAPYHSERYPELDGVRQEVAQLIDAATHVLGQAACSDPEAIECRDERLRKAATIDRLLDERLQEFDADPVTPDAEQEGLRRRLFLAAPQKVTQHLIEAVACAGPGNQEAPLDAVREN